MKKILFYLSSLGRGGAERVVVNLSEHFVKKGFEICIVTEKRQKEEYELSEQIKRVNLEDREKKRDSRLARIMGTIVTLRQVIKEEKPDLIVSFMGKVNLKAIVASSLLQIPTVVSVRADPREEYKKKAHRILAFMLFGMADGVIFQTDMAKEFFPKKIQDKGTILLNPINTEFIRESFQGARQHVVVTAGRLDANKNHRMLLKAFSLIQKDFPELCVKIYGNGEDRLKLEAYCKELGITEKIFFEGQTKNLLDKIYQAEVFVLCSDTEGMPNALLEAMAAGVPVISTDCPCGAPAMFIHDHENGILVPVDDAQRLAEAMTEVLKNPLLAEKMGKNATKIAEVLNPETVYEQWQVYIEKMMKSC